jgi:FkbM family methyltransferase
MRVLFPFKNSLFAKRRPKARRATQAPAPPNRDEPPEPIETISLNGVEVRVFVPGRWPQKRVREALTKDPEMIRWLDQLGPDDLLWDIGANVGIYSLYAALNRRCRVYAFEPGAANYYVLNRNIELNDAHERIRALCIAVAERSKFDVLNMRATVPGGSLSTFGEPIGARGETFVPRFTQGMVSFSLDDLAGHLPAPTHIKIDVDGIELPILLGGPKLLKNSNLRSVIVELDPDRPELLATAKELLASHGLRFSHSYVPQWEHIFVR